MPVKKYLKSKNTNKELKKLEEENKKLKKELEMLEKDLEKFEQIAKAIQQQYINLNQDFENYKKRIEKQQKELEEKLLIDIINQIIPLIENLRLSIENIPEDIKNHKWVEWIVLTYKNLLKILEWLGIYQKSTIWEEPNEIYHEPIGMLDANEKNKWKIIAEHQKCYIYKKWDKHIVIKPAKVIIGK